jgi:hypothetical protein
VFSVELHLPLTILGIFAHSSVVGLGSEKAVFIYTWKKEKSSSDNLKWRLCTVQIKASTCGVNSDTGHFWESQVFGDPKLMG